MKFIKSLEILTRILVFIVAIISSFYIAYNVNHPGYDLLFLLPLTYGCVFTFFISPILFKKSNMFIAVFTAVSFTRYVILPVLIVFSGWYGGRSVVPPLPSSFDLALKLMIYELIVVSIVIYFLFRKLKIYKKPQIQNSEVKLPENMFFYIVFVIFSLVLLGITPEAIRTFAFIIPSESMIDFGEGSTLVTITTYCLITSKYIVFLLLISFLYKKYLSSKDKIYIWLSFLVVFLNISIIFGDNRSDFIITSIVSIILFYKLYPKQSKVPIIFIIFVMVFMTGYITSHRNTVTYTRGEDPILDLTDTLQIYLGGPYNVAIATEVAELNADARTLSNLIYDLLRPAIGFNVIFKKLDGFEFSNYLFNYRIFYSDHVSQIMPMIGQGYFYFGFIFSHLFIIGFIIFVYFLIKILQKQNRLELIFFLSIPITRMGFAMGQNAGILINDTSFFLLLNLIVYYLNNKIVLTRSL